MDIQRGSSIRGTYAAAEKKRWTPWPGSSRVALLAAAIKKKHLWMKGDVLQVGIQPELRQNGI